MADKPVEIKVMMFGGRRCGKTSVLAAMQSCFEKEFGRSNLTIAAADDDTLFTIEEKNREIGSYFHNQGRSREFTPDSTPTLDIMEYKFNIGLKNKNSEGIVVNFIDYPGEWLADREKVKKITPLMKQSNIIIIAIDSPHLMEQTHSDEEDAVGEYNDARNYCHRIGDWIKLHFSGKSNLSAKMILFVPLKCEKYYHHNQMGVLNKKIKKAYSSTLNFFENNGQAYEVAITPILTCGAEDKGVEFARFARDDDGEIILDPKFRTPQKAIYIFTEKMSEPKPFYCEQPMIYVLAYVLEMVRQIKQQKRDTEGFFGGIWRFFQEEFFNLASAKDFLSERDNIKKAMKKTDNGYEIVSNPLGF